MGKDVRKKRTYSEIMDDVQKASYGKERRILHKELKESYGEGLPLFMRYPDLPMIVSIISCHSNPIADSISAIMEITTGIHHL